MQLKTRTEELIELLDPKGKTLVDVHDAILELKSTNDPMHEQICWKALDMKLEAYIELRIEKALLEMKGAK